MLIRGENHDPDETISDPDPTGPKCYRSFVSGTLVPVPYLILISTRSLEDKKCLKYNCAHGFIYWRISPGVMCGKRSNGEGEKIR